MVIFALLEIQLNKPIKTCVSWEPRRDTEPVKAAIYRHCVTLMMSLLCHQTSVAEYLTKPPLREEVSRSEAKIVFKNILFCTEGNRLTECKAVRSKCFSDHLEKPIFIPELFLFMTYFPKTGRSCVFPFRWAERRLLKLLFCASLPFIVDSSCFNTYESSFNLYHKRKLFSRRSGK